MFRWLLEPWLARRLEEFKKRSLPLEEASQADLTRVQRRLKWATVCIPLATLFYGLFDVRVGVRP